METWRQRPLNPDLSGGVHRRPGEEDLPVTGRARRVYVVVCIHSDGERDVLGMWAGTGGEGAKQWAG
ncbi:transposase [Micromonospora sediminicola]|uniref:transposase n=1 Tax=Micromonospora sediminicola TaxID=946078 RepID=UPI0037A016D4